GRTMQEVAQNDFGAANRFAGYDDQSLQSIGKVIEAAGQLIEVAARFINEAGVSSESDYTGQLLQNAGEMFTRAAGLIEDMSGMPGNQGINDDARRSYNEGQQHLRNAGDTLGNANGRVDDASRQ